jgi:hypothetical protein
MKQFDIKGIVTKPGQPTVQFQLTVNANDQASARRLVMMQYGAGGTVTINRLIEKKGK